MKMMAGYYLLDAFAFFLDAFFEDLGVAFTGTPEADFTFGEGFTLRNLTTLPIIPAFCSMRTTRSIIGYINIK